MQKLSNFSILNLLFSLYLLIFKFKQNIASLFSPSKMLRKIVPIGKFTLKIGFCLLIFLLIFVNFYSYSMLTRLAYSFNWLLAKTPLMSAQNEEIYIPSALSHIFNWLHNFKWFIIALQSMVNF